MAKKITFDNNHRVEPLTFILSSRAKVLQGQISNVDPKSIVYKTYLNGANELTFKYYKELNGNIDPLWESVDNLKLLYVKELDEFFEISLDIDESNETIKSVLGVSLCEAELSQTMLYNIEINSESDIARSDYVVTTFYDSYHPEASLLHRILEKVPHYSIAHVDTSLVNLQRTFSVDGVSVYDFLVGDCATEFNCLFQFNSTNRTISVYDLYTVCQNNNCSYYKKNGYRYRAPFNDKCPICGGTNISYFGKDTHVFVDKDNLTENIKYTTDVDSIKNTFKLEAGDDDMTATIVNNNPNGSAYIYYFSDESRNDMSPELVSKLDSYTALYSSYQDEYSDITEHIYECEDELNYLKHTMMPTHEDDNTDAKKEAAKLTVYNLSPLGVQKVSASLPTITSVNVALKNYAKVYINSGKYKIEVNTGQYSYVGIDSEGYHYGTWRGNFVVTNYANDEDTAISAIISVKVYDNYNQFINQKIKKQIAKDNLSVDDNSIYDVLNITDLNLFKTALTKYCKSRLESFQNALQSCIDIAMQAGYGDAGDIRHSLYSQYENKKKATIAEIAKRDLQIDSVEKTLSSYTSRRDQIQSALNFKKYLGTTLYNEFCMFKRETTYSNPNYISDGLDNPTIFDNAREFLDAAQKEAVIQGTAQHSIESDLYNLLLLEEFQPLLEYFELGNFIRIKVDNNIYRLRLIEYSIDYGSINTLNTKFSDMTKTADGLNDIRSILSQAKQMATSYDSVTKQASNGAEADVTLEYWLDNALDASKYKIQSNDTEDIVIDNHGIVARDYDDMYDTYDEHQLRITHNILAFTADNWDSVSLAIGEIEYDHDGNHYVDYGVIAKTILNGKFIGGDIYSYNYNSSDPKGSHINLGTGSFSLAGKRITYDANTNTFTIDFTAQGNSIVNAINATATTVNIKGENINFAGVGDEIAKSINASADEVNINANRINLSGTGGRLITEINANNDLTINASKLNLNGYTSINDYFNVSTDGQVTITNGNIVQYKNTSSGFEQIGFSKDTAQLDLAVYNTYTEKYEVVGALNPIHLVFQTNSPEGMSQHDYYATYGRDGFSLGGDTVSIGVNAYFHHSEEGLITHGALSSDYVIANHYFNYSGADTAFYNGNPNNWTYVMVFQHSDGNVVVRDRDGNPVYSMVPVNSQ